MAGTASSQEATMDNEPSVPFATHQERRNTYVAIAVVITFLAVMALGCAFLPTIPLFSF